MPIKDRSRLFPYMMTSILAVFRDIWKIASP